MPTTFSTRLNNYVLELTATSYAGRSKLIPAATLQEYCGDSDGCDVTIGLRNWSSSAASESANASKTFHLFVSSQNAWRTSNDVSGIDGNGASEHLFNLFDTCYLTDGAYSSFTNLGDSAVGISLMMWNGYGGTTRRCTLVLRD
ncbi:MAG: hypothetical protein JNJ54_01430 [Myxococcaceae bacterium]|nr:hypothetical protein [Myxococcaceae bacterium]